MAEKSFGVKEINLIGASGTPTIESPNNLNLNAVNVAISTNATIGGNLTVSGTVGIAGTLTYEDVTNIDAIGIITARNGVNLTGGNLSLGDSGGSSDDRISIGAGGDINIYHNGTDSYVSNATGDLRLFSVGGSADDVLIRAQDDIELQPNNGQSGVKVIGTGAVELYHNNSKKLETSSSGATVTGTLAATAVTGDGSALTGIAVTEAPVTDYTISANGSSAYRIHGGGVDETANNPDLYLIRGQKYRFNNTTGGGHPFAIRVSNGGSAYTDGVSGSQSGIQFFTVPYAAPASLVYQCTIHSGMVGNIYIRGGSSTVTVSTNSDNRVITGGSGGNLNGEANLTFTGQTLTAHMSTADPAVFVGDSNRDNAGQHLAEYRGYWDGNQIGRIVFAAGDDTDNKDDGIIKFHTTPSGGSITERLRITSTGNIGINSTNPNSRLTVAQNSASAIIEIQRTNTNSGGAFGALNFTALDSHSVANIIAKSDGDNEGAHLIFKTTTAAGENNPYGSNTLERLRIKSDGVVLIGTEYADSIGTINSHLVVGSTTNNDEVGLTLNVMEGSNGRRVKFFLDDDDGVFGIDSTASSGVAPFVVRMATSEKLRITNVGRVYVGGQSGRSPGGLTPQFQLEGTDASSSSMSLTRNSVNAGSSSLTFNKTRGAALNADTAVKGNDTLGIVQFVGSDGTDSDTPAAWVLAKVDDSSSQTMGSNEMPGRLEFHTRSDTSSGSLQERLRIDSSGNVTVKSSSGNQQPKLRVESYGEYGEIKADGNGSIILSADPDFNANNSYIGFQVDGSEKARITSTGFLGVGNGGTYSIETPVDVVTNHTTAAMDITTGSNNHYQGDTLGDITLTRRHSSTKHNTFGYSASMLDFRATNSSHEWSVGQILGHVDPHGGTGYKGALSILVNRGGGQNPTGRRSQGEYPQVSTLFTSQRVTTFSNETVSTQMVLHLTKNSASASTAQSMIAFDVGGVGRGQIKSATNTTASPTLAGYSDRRLKTNFRNYTGGYDKIKQIPVKLYDEVLNDDTKSIVLEAKKDCIGWIADEVQSIFPEAVSGTKDEVDSDGKPVYQSLSEGSFFPDAIQAIQKLIQKVETLEAEVAALKSS